MAPVNNVMVVLGSQWGDEGKGKLVDLLASEGVDVVARCAGGNNAGHTVVVGETHFAFHLLPSGVVIPGCVALLGNGVVIHVPDLLREIEENETKGLAPLTPDRFKISDRAHLVFDLHQQVDGLQEEKRRAVVSVTANGTGNGIMLGTTKKGIGPTYASKMNRSGLRVSDLVYGDFDTHFADRFRRLVSDFSDAYSGLAVDVPAELDRYRKIAEKIRPFVTETVSYLHNELSAGKRVLVEGANAAMLDIDLGTYPYVTSSNCTVGGVCTGLGLPPAKIGSVFGVVKAYTTRVGTGAFPTEQLNDIGERLQSIGHEFGVTTGRKRRCGWLDIPLLHFTNMVNNYTAVALTKLDILDSFDEIKIGVTYKKNGKPVDHFPSSEQDYEGVEVEYITLPGWKTPISACRSFDDLPGAAQTYVRTIEQLLNVPIWWIGVGQARDAIIRNRPTSTAV